MVIYKKYSVHLARKLEVSMDRKELNDILKIGETVAVEFKRCENGRFEIGFAAKDTYNGTESCRRKTSVVRYE